MYRLALAVALALALSLALLPGAAGANPRGSHVTVIIGHGFHPGCCAFVHRPFFPHRHHFIHRGFFFPSSSLVVVNPPAAQPVWIPGFWQWNGFQWVWMPGHWAFVGP